MLNLLDDSLESFLRAAVPLTTHDVDISFAAPDRDWGARVTRPTVDLFLWDVRRNLAEQDAGEELAPGHNGRNGRRERRAPLPRMDCRYLVTAWTSEVRDEHSLLGAVLQACLVTAELPEQYLQGAYRDVRPLPALRVGMPDGKDTADFWSAIGGQLKPGLDLVVTATVPAAIGVPVGPPIDEYMLRTRRADAGPETEPHVLWTRTGTDGPRHA